MKRTVIIALLLAAGGCASRPLSEIPANEIQQQSLVSRDNFKKFTQVDSAVIFIPGDPLPRGRWQLLAKKDDGASEIDYLFLVRLDSGRDGWAFLSEAFDRDGNKFPLLPLSKEVSGRMTFEQYTARLTRPYLEEAAKLDKIWRLYGRREVIMSIPSNVAGGFLAKVDQTFPAK